ncbi:S-adenosyl-L-methionine-dependent methyltransferase [Apiospora arundinis]|uniref:S-adenosyl-L-methionine-dependent methyltransferase n=1 Tax=Apiospora arundinis TaxID=335852 RepID=A0ABR2HPR7_9PEZI
MLEVDGELGRFEVDDGQPHATGLSVQHGLSPVASTPPSRSPSYTNPDLDTIEEDGRGWNGYRPEKYWLPNDGAEQDRLDLQHELWLLLMKKRLSWAPIDAEPSRVLDIGTGTGIWACDYADAHPMTEVIGTDLSLIQPNYSPPNCRFVREDAEEEWVHDRPFDYIHARMMTICFKDPVAMVRNIFDNLQPGGWAEYQEIGADQVAADAESEEFIQSDPFSLREYMRRVIQGAANLGRDINVAPKLKDWFHAAGFVDVTVHQILGPLNAWSRDPVDHQIGSFITQDVIEVVQSASKFYKAYGMTDDQISQFVEGCCRHVRSTKCRSYIPWYVVYGRKPREGEASDDLKSA